MKLPPRLSPLPPFSRRAFLLTAAAALAATGLPRPVRAAPIAPGGTLRFGFIGMGALGGLEPHLPSGEGAIAILLTSNVIEGLARRANDGGLEMMLAESITADDDTAIRWTIRLKPGVTFHDGSAMTATDVVASLRRITQPGAFGAGAVGPVETIEAVDPLTVKLVLGAPRSWLPDGLSTIWCGIVPAGFDPAKPVGTGPFAFGAVELTKSITLTRFDGYHGTPAVLDSVVIIPFSDPTAELNALFSGQVDLITGLDGSVLEEIAANPGFAVHSVPSGAFSQIQMRTDVAPFNDVRLRQALRLVIDRQMVVDVAYGGQAVVANDLYSPFDPNFDKDLIRTRDVAAARALIEDAGLTGTELELVMLDDVAVALILAENAKEIGLEIKVTPLELAAFYGEGYMDRPFFGGDRYPSLPYFMISSMSDGPGNSLDQIRWRDPDYLDLWQQATATVDPAERRKLMFRMQEILFERGGWIIPAYFNELAASAAKVSGLPQDDTTGFSAIRALSKIGFTA